MSAQTEFSSKNKVEIVSRLKKVSTTTLSDAMDKVGIRGCMSSSIRPLRSGSTIAGPARTIKRIRKPQNLGKEEFKEYAKAHHEIIDSAQAGDVLVFAVDKETEGATVGELMCTRATVKGLAGAIVDGGIRDSREIAEMGFLIFMRSIVPTSGAVKLTTVGTNIPVICGDILVHPGDMIVADDDGVAVLPKDRVGEILKMAEEIQDKERQMAEYLRKGHNFIEAENKYKVA